MFFKSENKRFVKKYSQGSIECCQIIVDTETGVNYLYRVTGYAGGLTVLVDADGKPVITSPEEISSLLKDER